MFNDPALSIGIEVKDVLTMQYDGFLIGALFKAAGAEGIKLSFSDGEESQSIPAVDVAIDEGSLTLVQGPSPGMSFGGFTLMNQPMKKGTKISITQEGTGTAEGNVWVIFSLTATGAYILNVAVLKTVTALTSGDTIMNNPTFMSRLKRIFIRGVGANDITVALGAGGQTIVIPCRSKAVNTDIEPWTYHSIDSEVPDKLLFVAHNGFTGTAWFYVQFE